MSAGASNRFWKIITESDRLVIFLLAIATALIWLLSEPIVFTNDSFGYLVAAKYIAGVSAHGIPYYRMPLFPVILVATGVAQYGTFFWFIVAQTVLGIIMIMLFHDAVRAYSTIAGLIATVLFAFTFVPLVYSKAVMTEQIYLFGLILCLSSALAYLYSGNRFRLALIAGAILIMMLTRVQGIFIALVVFPFLLFVRRQYWRSISTAAAVVLLAMSAYSLIYSAQVRKHEPFRSEAAAEPALSNSVGKYLFMVPYLDAYRYFDWKLVEPNNGPASARLFSLTDDKPPTLDQWWAIWQTLDKEIGVATADDLLLSATIEAVIAHPFKAAVLYAHNLAVATYRLNSSYVWRHPPVRIDDDRLNDELKSSGDQSSDTWLARIVNPFFHMVLVVATLLVFVTVGAHGAAWAFCVALYVYNLVAIAASGAPEGRIVFYGLPLLLAALVTARSKPWLLRLLRPIFVLWARRGISIRSAGLLSENQSRDGKLV
ncbi:MAG TPA: hypothetical protein VGH13_09135 [Xanthobacteraceae bacterium]